MPAPSRPVVAGAAVAFVAAVTAIYLGTRAPDTQPGKRRVSVGWAADAGPGVATRCLWTTAWASPSALALFGLDAGQGLGSYVRASVCGDPVDGGAGPTLPAGMVAIESSQTEHGYDGGPQVFAALGGEVEQECACSPGVDSGCEMVLIDGGWGPAVLGNTLREGWWRGGCYRKACVELAGVGSSWPTLECPQ